MNTKKKFFSRKIVRYTLLVVLCLICFFTGMYAHKNESIRNKISSLKTPFQFNYSNYKKGQAATPKLLSIQLTDDEYSSLKTSREGAIKAGYLKEEFKNEVKAIIVWGEDSLKSKVRLKGDFPDHWSGEKWSLRINLKGKDRVKGMDKFSVQAPETRKGMVEWYYHQLLKSFNLLSLNYEFIQIQINGENKGIFAMEEAFSKEIILNAGRNNAPILKFDENAWINQIRNKDSLIESETDFFYKANITLFSGKKVMRNQTQYSYYLDGKNKLERFRNGQNTVAETFNLKATAMYFALSDLTGTYHGARWHNNRFYYNPDLKRLEFIGFDSGSGNQIEMTFFDLWQYGKMTEYHGLPAWKSLFFQDEAFVNAYFNALSILSDDSMLPTFNSLIKTDMDAQLANLYKDDSFYGFDTLVYYKNNEVIKKSVKRYFGKSEMINEKCQFELILDSLNTPLLLVSNYNPAEVELISITNTSNRLSIQLDSCSVPKRNINRPVEQKQFSVKVPDYGLDHFLTSAIILEKDHFYYENIHVSYRVNGESQTRKGQLIRYNSSNE